MATLLKGAAVSAALLENLTARADALRAKGVAPTLAIVRVGEKPDDIAYEKSAAKRCAAAGVAVENIVLPADVWEEDLRGVITALNADEAIHGVLLLRPLPKHIDESAVCELLSPKKDVDGVTSASLAGVFMNSGMGYPPCTARAVMETLRYYGVELKGKNAAVVGRSLVIGRPVAMMLLSEHATVTICHTRTRDLPNLCRKADILVAAAGRAGMITREYLAPGQIVIDVGINVDAEGKLCGDVNAHDADELAEAYTPVPGGLGTVTSTVLAAHVIDAAEKAAK